MTVSSTVNTSPIYAGNDTTGPWAFSFKTFAQEELEVIKASATGVETILTLTTDYTVSLNGDQNASPGGEVTTVANVATGESLRVRWVGIPTQETDIQNASGFYPEVIENALDKLTMLTQRNTEEVGRAVKTTITSGDDPDALVASLLAAEANAAASEAAAAVSAGNASTSETNAAASAASVDPTSFVKRDGTQGMQGLLQLDYSSDIASAATVDLGTATGNSVDVTHSTGTTAITSLGGASLQAGTEIETRFVITGGTLTLTHHATNLYLAGGANITLANGDVIRWRKMHSSNAEWKMVGGVKADGTAWATSMSTARLIGRTTAGTGAQEEITVGSGLTLSAGSLTASSGITLGTPVATTSGTSIEFTSIPAAAKRITINFSGVSTTGGSQLICQLGDSGGVEATGYTAIMGLTSSTGANGSTLTSGFPLSWSTYAAADTISGSIVFNLENSSSNTWTCHGVLYQGTVNYAMLPSGVKSLSAVLDRVRITTASGTPTFDAGEINITYES